MIQSFRCKRTAALFEDIDVVAFRAIERSARRIWRDGDAFEVEIVDYH